MRRFPALLLCIMLLSGCSTVKVKPFNDFRDAVKNASTGIDNGLDYNYRSSREAFAEKFASEKDAKFSGLVITKDDEGGWQWGDKPSYVDIGAARNTVSAVNQSFCEYADLLCKLAAAEFLSEEDLDKSISTLNMNIRSAIAKAGLPKENEGAALFTVSAVESAKSYLNYKRASALGEALEENQASVKNYSELCGNLVGLIRSDIRTSYTEKAEVFKTRWEAAQTPDSKKEIVAQMLKMNDEYAALNEMLDAISAIYGRLPGIHSSLRKGIDNKAFFYEDLQRVTGESQRLYKLYEKLRKQE